MVLKVLTYLAQVALLLFGLAGIFALVYIIGTAMEVNPI